MTRLRRLGGFGFRFGKPAFCAVLCALALPSVADYVVQSGTSWLPFVSTTKIKPGSALDFSGFRPTGAPAGKYGRVIVNGDRFEFEKLPGKAQRFYGVNLCFTANYLEPEESKKLASELARVGYNAVRLHHHDNQLAKQDGDRTEIDPINGRLLDALVAACIENGLYLTTDLFVSRKVPYRAIGMDLDGYVGMQDFKELVQVHEGAYRNFIEFSRNFLNRKNEFTGRRYADEPALAWMSLVNEGNLGNHDMRIMKRFSIFKEKYSTWLAEKKQQDPETYGIATGELPKTLHNLKDPNARIYEIFLAELERDFARRVTKFMREEIKSKQLLTNLNCWHYHTSIQKPRAEEYDYVDDHFYVDHPKFLEKMWRLPSSCPNSNPLKGDGLGVQSLAVRRIIGKPFTITEYNYSGPGRFRGVGGIATGAMAALQDWSGLWRFAWSHSKQTIEAAGNSRMDYFDMARDPLALASERASLCLFLREDLKPLGKTYAALLPKDKVTRPEGVENLSWVTWLWAGWYAKIGMYVGDALPEGVVSAGEFPACFRKLRKDVREDLKFDVVPRPKMGDGHVFVNGGTGTFILDTPRTAGGFAETGSHKAGALKWTLDGAATLWASSLDGKPVESSRRILFTHLTDVQNTGMKYRDETLKVLLEWGTTPHLMRIGKAEVQLKCAPGLKVYSLESSGERRGVVPSAYADGVLSFTADVAREQGVATYLYEIAE